MDWLRRDVAKNVTYVAPRRILVESIAERVEASKPLKMTDRGNKAGIQVHRFYLGGDAMENGRTTQKGRPVKSSTGSTPLTSTRS